MIVIRVGILSVEIEGDRIFNRNHAFAPFVKPVGSEVVPNKPKQDTIVQELKLASESNGSAKILFLMSLLDLTRDQWQGLHDNNPKLFTKLLDIETLASTNGELRIYRSGYPSGLIAVTKKGAKFLSHDGWSGISRWTDLEGRLPKPAKKWWIGGV